MVLFYIIIFQHNLVFIGRLRLIERFEIVDSIIIIVIDIVHSDLFDRDIVRVEDGTASDVSSKLPPSPIRFTIILAITLEVASIRNVGCFFEVAKVPEID